MKRHNDWIATHPLRLTALGMFAMGLTLLSASPADAAGTIKRPNAHPDYSFEAEPHLVLGWIDPPGDVDGDGYGLGFRGTFELVDPGFIKGINNTVGLGIGIDWVDYDYKHCYHDRNRRDWCDDDHQNYIWIPIVMQWNFFLHDKWSVFGEPGGAIRLDGPGDDYIDPFIMYVGGRWHFADFASLTMRLGYPAFSVGVSFFL
jgi:hypothetical protein